MTIIGDNAIKTNQSPAAILYMHAYYSSIGMHCMWYHMHVRGTACGATGMYMYMYMPQGCLRCMGAEAY